MASFQTPKTGWSSRTTTGFGTTLNRPQGTGFGAALNRTPGTGFGAALNRPQGTGFGAALNRPQGTGFGTNLNRPQGTGFGASRFGTGMSRFGSSNRTGTYSFRTTPHIIFSLPRSKERQDLEDYLSSPNQSDLLFLLNPAYKFNIFDYVPRDFTITTNKGSYIFNSDFLKDASPLINQALTENPDHFQYHLNSKDEYNSMEKIEKLFLGQIIEITAEENPFFRRITDELKTTRVMRMSSGFGSSSSSNRNREMQITLSSLNSYLSSNYPRTFKISTKKKVYECNKIGVYSSKVIRELLLKDPTLDKYDFDFDDECNEFNVIHDLFNFQLIKLTADNMNSVKEIAEELQIDFILKDVDKFIDDYDKRIQTIDDQQATIDSIDELFDTLFKIKETTAEVAKEKIINSEWVETDEDVQELSAFILQVIQTDILLHPYLAELLELLDKEADEISQLKMLVPIIVKKLMSIFCRDLVINSFIFILHQKGFIQKEDIMDKIENVTSNLTFAEPKVDDSDNAPTKTSKFSSASRGRSRLPDAYLFFLPELYEILNSDLNKLLQCFSPNMESFIISYFPENVENFINMRKSGEPDDELTKALRNDDVDTFQTIVTQKQINLADIKNYVPYNIFEGFVSNGVTNYINYSAAYGSVKCFKYLLVNHAELNRISLQLAVYGGNTEIVQIIDQKSNEIKPKKPEPEKKRTFGSRTLTSASSMNNVDNIVPTIRKHQNNLFDWILEHKFTNMMQNTKLLYNIILTSAINGNAHSITAIVDKGFDFINIDNKMCFEIISNASKNGFYKLLTILITLMSKKLEQCDLSVIFDSESAVSYGNLSIYKLYHEKAKTIKLNNNLVYAIEQGNKNIVQYIFENAGKNDIDISQDSIYSMLASSIRSKNSSLFNYLVDHFDKFEPNPLSSFDYNQLLTESCYSNNVESSKLISELIFKYSNDQKFDFSLPFFNAAVSGSVELCQYFIDKKVFINFKLLSFQIQKIASCKKEILEIIFKNIDENSKEIIKSCYFKEVIKAKNKYFIEYLLNEKVSISDDALFDAVNSRDIEIVNLILNHKSEPSFINQVSTEGTALNIAVKLDNIDIVKRLLSLPGIDPSLYESSNQTPLITAITKLDINMINAILDFYGPDIKSQSWQLDEAVKKFLNKLSNNKRSNRRVNDDSKFLTVLNRLLEIESIDINCHSDKYSLFSYACEANEIDIIKTLLKNDKVDVNSYAPADGNTPLLTAIAKSQVETAKLLINCDRVDINQSNYAKDTPLTLSVRLNLSELVDIIIKNENFDPVKSDLNRAFYISRDIEMKKKLIDNKNLDVNYKCIVHNQNRQDKRNVSTIRRFAQGKTISFNTNSTLNLLSTPLISAVKSNQAEIVDLIINHPSFDPEKSFAKEAVFIACSNQDIDTFHKLLQLINNDVNIVNDSGLTLLEAAINTNLKEMINEVIDDKSFDSKKNDLLNVFNNILSNKRIEFDIVNKLIEFDSEHDHLIDFTKLLPNGKSYYTNIRNRNPTNFSTISQFLLEHGVDPNAPDKFGVYPLEFAISSLKSMMALTLIDSGKIDFSVKLNSNLSSRSNQTSASNLSYLHLAAVFNNNTNVLSTMLSNKVININIEDSNGETPLFYAVRARNVKNIRRLFDEDDLDYLHCNNDGDDALKVSLKINNKKEETQPNSKGSYLESLLSHLKKSTFSRLGFANRNQLKEKDEESENKEKDEDNKEKDEEDDENKEKDEEDEENKEKEEDDDENKEKGEEDDENKEKDEEDDENKEKDEKDDENKEKPKAVSKFGFRSSNISHKFGQAPSSSAASTITSASNLSKSKFSTKLTTSKANSHVNKNTDEDGQANSSKPSFSMKNRVESSDAKPTLKQTKFGESTEEEKDMELRKERFRDKVKLLINKYEEEEEINDNQNQYNYPERSSYQTKVIQSQWNQMMQLSSVRNAQFDMIMQQQQQQMMSLYQLSNANKSHSSKHSKRKKKGHK